MQDQVETDRLRDVIEYLWPEMKGVYGPSFGDFLGARQEDWDNVYAYDLLYRRLAGNQLVSLHGHTGAPTPMMEKHAAYYGLRWEGGVVYSPTGKERLTNREERVRYVPGYNGKK